MRTRLIIWGVLVLVVLVSFLGRLQITWLGDAIHVFPANGNIFYATDSTRVLFEADCTLHTWHIYEVDSIRLNGIEHGPDGQERWCGEAPTLNVTLQNGETYTHQFEYESILPVERFPPVVRIGLFWGGLVFLLPFTVFTFAPLLNRLLRRQSTPTQPGGIKRRTALALGLAAVVSVFIGYRTYDDYEDSVTVCSGWVLRRSEVISNDCQ